MPSIGAMLSWRAGMVLAATTLGVLGSAGAASAATYTVNTTKDTNDGACTASLCSLRDAVVAADTAGGASTISVPAGTYQLTIPSTAANDPTNGDLDIKSGATVTLTGAGSGSTVIDANQVDRAFAVQSGGALSLSKVTIENGNPASTSSGSQLGGAIWSQGGLTVGSDTAFVNNSVPSGSQEGGAIYADTASTLSVTGASFQGNQAYADGGAIYDASTTATSVSNSTFSANLANDADGGAIYAASGAGALTVDSSSFSNNLSNYGGAIYMDSVSALKVTKSTFTGNNAAWEEGGAVFDAASASTTLSSDRFVNNVAGYGGALYLDSSATSPSYTLNTDEFDGNTATYDGGAVYWIKGSLSSAGSSFTGGTARDGGGIYAGSTTTGAALSLVNATISGNTANSGGGLYFNTATPSSLTNDTIAYNAAGALHGGGIYHAADITTTGGATGVLNTIVADNTHGDCGDGTGTATEKVLAASDAGHNLDSDGTCFGGLGVASDHTSVDPKLGHAADNGGPVLTDAELSGSPAIDAGTNTGCPATDARGVARPQGSACDIGAYEAAAAPLTVTNSAPGTAVQNVPFNDTITVTPGGPAFSTGTTVTETLPAGETLYGTSASQGTCTQSGSTVTCDLGTLASGSSATVTLVLAEANVGSLTNTATATNDQGASVPASATTVVSKANPGAAPGAQTGPAKSISKNAATLTGSVTTGGQRTAYFFEIGTTKGYGVATPVQYATSDGAVSAKVLRLRLGTRYHYRLVAVNDTGIARGADRSFKTKGTLTNGALLLRGRNLVVRGGKLYAKFTCRSTKACVFRFSIGVHAKVKKSKKTATVLFLQARTTLKRIGAHKTATVTASVTTAGMALLRHSGGHLSGKLTTRPRTAQKGIIALISITQR